LGGRGDFATPKQQKAKKFYCFEERSKFMCWGVNKIKIREIQVLAVAR
jgi:hypothetical protein